MATETDAKPLQSTTPLPAIPIAPEDMVYFAIEDCIHIAQFGKMRNFIIYFNNL
jgi:hypothetical protein